MFGLQSQRSALKRLVPTSAGRQLVAVLRPGTTSWTAPRAGKYTIYAFGPGGAPANNSANAAGGGGLSVKTVDLAAGAVLNVIIGRAGTYSTSQQSGAATTVSGPGISLSANAGGDVFGSSGGAASGGDANYPGAASGTSAGSGAAGTDGSLYGSGGVSIIGVGPSVTGISPGGGGIFSGSANGEIRIVQEVLAPIPVDPVLLQPAAFDFSLASAPTPTVDWSM